MNVIEDLLRALKDGAHVQIVDLRSSPRVYDDPVCQELYDLTEKQEHLAHSFRRTYDILKGSDANDMAAAVREWWAARQLEFAAIVDEIFPPEAERPQDQELRHDLITKVTSAVRPLVEHCLEVDQGIKERHRAAFRNTDLSDLLV